VSTKIDQFEDVAAAVVAVASVEETVSVIVTRGIASWMTGKETGALLGTIGVVTVGEDMTTWVLARVPGVDVSSGITMDMGHRAALQMID
jgi:hypothetical protein